MKIVKHITTFIIALAFGFLTLVVVAQIPQVRDVVVVRLLGMVNEQINGELQVAGIGGDLLSGLELRGVKVRYRGDLLLSADRVAARWNLLSLGARKIDITGVWIDGVGATLSKRSKREWDVGQALSLRKPATGKSRFSIAVARLELRNAEIRLLQDAGTRRISIGKLEGAVNSNPREFSLEIIGAQGKLSAPAAAVSRAKGRFVMSKSLPRKLRWDGIVIELQASIVRSSGAVELDARKGLELEFEAEPLSPVDLNPLGSPLSIPVSLRVHASGPWSQIGWRFSADSTAGVIQSHGFAALPFTAPTSPEWENFSLSATGSVTKLIPAVWLARPAGRATRITTDFWVNVERAGRAERSVAATFDGGKSKIGGFPVRSFLGALRYDAGRIRGNLRLVSARSRITASANVRLKSKSYTGSVQVQNFRPQDWIDSRWKGNINFTARLEGKGFDPDRLTAEGRVMVTQSRIGTYGIRRVSLPLKLNKGIVSVKQAVFDTTVLDARLHGELPIRKGREGRMNLLARVDDLSLLYPEAATQGVAGRVMVHLRVRGSLEKMSLVSTIRGLGLKYRQVLVPDLDVGIEGHRLNVMKKEGALEALARFTTPAYGETRFEEVVGAFSLERLAKQQEGTFYLSALKDGIENRLRGRYEIAMPGFKVVLEDFAVSTEGNQWRNQGEAVVDIQSDKWVIRNLDLRNGEQQLQVDGRLSPEAGQNLRIRMNRVQLGQFGPLLGRSQTVGGQLDGSVWLTGTIAAPVVESTLALADVTVGGYKIQLATLVFLYRERWLSGELRVMQSLTSGVIMGDARIPLDLGRIPAGQKRIDDRKMSGRIVSKELSLTIIEAATGQIDNAQGIVNMDIRLAGTLRAPLFKGQLDLSGGRFRVRPTRVTYSDVSLRAVLRNRTITFTTVQLRSEKNGRLRGDGAIVLASVNDAGHLGIRLVADNLLLVDNARATASVDADLTLTGTSVNPVLTGSVSPRRVLITPPPRTNKRLEALNFDYPGIHVIQPGGVQATLLPTPDSTEIRVSPLTGALVNVVLLMDRNVWIRNNDVNVELGGQVSAFKAAGEKKLRFVGEIHAVRGFYRLQGKRLDIQEGRASFAGTNEINPVLDITLTHEVPDYLVTAHVTGTMRKPVLDLSSQPALEESDIFAVLLFGKPFDRLEQGEQVAMRERVGQLLGGFAAEELRRQLGGQLGIDTLELSPSGEGEDEGAGPTLGVGKYVSQDVFVQYLQRFGADAGSEVRLEYYFTRHWLVQTTAATGGQSGLDVFWRVTF